MSAGRGSGGGSRRPVWRVLVPVIALAAGVLFATSAETAQGTDLRAGRRIELTQLIAAQERAVGDSTRRAVGLQAQVDTLEKDASTKDGRVGAVRAHGQRLEGQVGLRPLRGPGLTVELNDAPRRPDGSLPPNARPDDVIVHQQDEHRHRIPRRARALAAGRPGRRGQHVGRGRVHSALANLGLGHLRLLLMLPDH